MRKTIFLIIGMIYLSGCKTDLVVKDINVVWDDVNKKAFVTISNEGDIEAKDFLVYVNGDEIPMSENRRPQISHLVEYLEGNSSITLEADFAPLAHYENSQLLNVYQITAIADPKNTVEELLGENNNVKSEFVPFNSNLPLVLINTGGQQIVDEPKIPADMKIIYD